jgi:hypothetical protein
MLIRSVLIDLRKEGKLEGSRIGGAQEVRVGKYKRLFNHVKRSWLTEV